MCQPIEVGWVRRPQPVDRRQLDRLRGVYRVRQQPGAAGPVTLPDAELTAARCIGDAGADYEPHRVRRELRRTDLRVPVGERLGFVLAGRVELRADRETGPGLRQRRVALDRFGELCVAGLIRLVVELVVALDDSLGVGERDGRTG